MARPVVIRCGERSEEENGLEPRPPNRRELKPGLTFASRAQVDVDGMLVRVPLYRPSQGIVLVSYRLSRKLPRPSPLVPPSSPLLGRFPLTSMAPNAWIPNRYPQSRRSDHTDVYKSKANGSVSVPDPYNWLEKNSEETTRWVTEQEEYTREYLRSSPDWDRVEADIRKVTDYAKVRVFAHRPIPPRTILFRFQVRDRS